MPKRMISFQVSCKVESFPGNVVKYRHALKFFNEEFCRHEKIGRAFQCDQKFFNEEFCRHEKIGPDSTRITLAYWDVRCWSGESARINTPMHTQEIIHTLRTVLLSNERFVCPALLMEVMYILILTVLCK
ncbi:hypothetical protein QE152_g29666 [Popillia japonica]|uniref:Uncharacterized protein n=1 Tax=Popillia japonica TaxID=7064 RepID=A0AAW1JGT6_POPJA